MKKEGKILTALAILGGAFCFLRKKGVLKSKQENFSATALLAGQPIFANSSLNIPFQINFKSSADTSARLNSISASINGNSLGSKYYENKDCNISGGGSIDNVELSLNYNLLVQYLGQNVTAEITSGNFDNLLKLITISANITVGNSYQITYSRPVGQAQSWNLKLLHSDKVNGLGFCAASLRRIGPLSDYIAYIPPISELEKNDRIVKANGSVQDTAAIMHEAATQYKSDTAKLAQHLKKGNVKDTLQSIWNFVYGYIQYVPDSRIVEQVRRPLRTLYDQKGDCDCYATLIASMLENLGIPYDFRIAAYQRDWQHVYVIVPNGNSYYVVDPVMDKCFAEKEPTKTLDL